MEQRVLEAEGIERRGIVRGTIIKLKQICNHPDQYLGQTKDVMVHKLVSKGTIEEKILGCWVGIQSAKHRHVKTKCHGQPAETAQKRERDASHCHYRESNYENLVGKCMV